MTDPLDDQLPESLALRLNDALPGRAAQSAFSPELAYGRHFGPPNWDTRPAAVLALLYPHQGRWHVPLTLRPAHMVDHAGQISLPGGSADAGENAEACALREYSEELRVASNEVRVLGRLSPLYVFNSNFLVCPCVGVAAERPDFRPNPAEVERLLEVELTWLIDQACRTRRSIRRRGVCFQAEHLLWRSDAIWGATGMILGELIQVLQEVMDGPDCN